MKCIKEVFTFTQPTGLLLKERICMTKAEKYLQRIGGNAAQCNVRFISVHLSITVSTAHVTDIRPHSMEPTERMFN
jgi:uncharacterized protein (UPF0276 family)